LETTVPSGIWERGSTLPITKAAFLPAKMNWPVRQKGGREGGREGREGEVMSC